MNFAKAFSMFLITTVTGLAFAQPMSPAEMGYADQMERQRIGNVQNYHQQQDAAAAAEANRRWWARERKILAEIEQHKVTPYYGTLVARVNNYAISWGGGGYISPKRAEEKAMELCEKTEVCHVLLTFANTCAGVAGPDHLLGSKYLIVATDPNPQKAIEKAYYACEGKYGSGKCSYSANKHAPKYSNGYCSGYNYEAYNQR